MDRKDTLETEDDFIVFSACVRAYWPMLQRNVEKKSNNVVLNKDAKEAIET